MLAASCQSGVQCAGTALHHTWAKTRHQLGSALLRGLSCHHSHTSPLISSPQILMVSQAAQLHPNDAIWHGLSDLFSSSLFRSICISYKYFSVHKTPPQLLNLHYMFEKYLYILYSPVTNSSAQWIPASRVYLDFPSSPPWALNSAPLN